MTSRKSLTIFMQPESYTENMWASAEDDYLKLKLCPSAYHETEKRLLSASRTMLDLIMEVKRYIFVCTFQRHSVVYITEDIQTDALGWFLIITNCDAYWYTIARNETIGIDRWWCDICGRVQGQPLPLWSPISLMQQSTSLSKARRNSSMRWPLTDQQISVETSEDISNLAPECQHAAALMMMRSLSGACVCMSSYTSSSYWAS